MSAPCPIYGFTVDVQLATGVSEADVNALWQSFARALETRGLERAGGARVDDRWPCAVRSEASQAANADREAIRAWADGRQEIATVRIGPLVDLSSRD